MTSVSHTNSVGSHLGNLASCTVLHTISVSWMHQSVAQFWHLYPSRSYPNYTGNKRHSPLSSFHLLPTLSLPSPLLASFLSIFFTAFNKSHLYCVDRLHTTSDDPLSRSGCVCVRFCPARSSLMHSSASQILEALWPRKLRCEWTRNLQTLSLFSGCHREIKVRICTGRAEIRSVLGIHGEGKKRAPKNWKKGLLNLRNGGEVLQSLFKIKLGTVVRIRERLKSGTIPTLFKVVKLAKVSLNTNVSWWNKSFVKIHFFVETILISGTFLHFQEKYLTKLV